LVLPERAGENMAIGGLEPNMLKKLKGLRFGLPSSSIVLAKHIGRGATDPSRYWCRSFKGVSLGVIVSIVGVVN